MAAQAAGLDYEDFDAWSATGDNYGGERETRTTWKGFTPDRGIGPGTLFGVAREHGWSDRTTGAPAAPAESLSRPRRTQQSLAPARHTPIPDDAPSPPARHPQLDAPSATWTYRDADGCVLFYVYRFDGKADPSTGKPAKEFRPLTFDGDRWQWKGLGAPRPLYGLDRLAARADAPVIVTEGEKAADAAPSLVPDAVCIASANGSDGARQADWSPLQGRRVILWPDSDEPGAKYVANVAELLRAAGAFVVGVVDVRTLANGEPAPGWDAADALADGMTPRAFDALPLFPSNDAGQKQLQAANDNAVEDHIDELNRSHAVVLMADKAVVLRETHNDRDSREVRFLPPASLKTFYANRTAAIDVLDQHGRPRTKHVPIVDDWMRSPRRRSYEGVTFAPANNEPHGYYNLWRGFAVEPLNASIFAAGMRCRRFLSHLKVNVCGGNREHFRYLLAWTADMLQDPDEKKGVALVLRGEKGVGKSTFADVVRKLLGDHAIKVSHLRHLTGNFNRHLSDKLLVVAEESFWAGDKNDEGPLKDMITSDTLTVEAKGVDAIEIRSLCRIIMVTNSEWAVPATSDERRYFVLDVGNRHRQDLRYFAAIREQLDRRDREGLRAFLALLLKFPLASCNLRKVPETDGLRTQRALSLEPHDQFIFDALLDRSIAGVEWFWGAIVGKAEVYDAYIDAARKRGKSHLMPANVFAKHFMQTTGAAQTRTRSGADRICSWKLPAWDMAAAQFEQARKVDVIALSAEPHRNEETGPL